MVIRIPTPDIQGAQRLGGMQAQAADTPFQRLNMPDTTFNARMLQQLGTAGVQFANYLQEQQDERLLLEFQSGIGDWERSLLFGEMPDGQRSPNPGLLALQERDAFGVTERVAAEFEENLSQYNETLSGLSRNGQLAAQTLAENRRNSLLDQTARFEFQQREAYNNRLRREAEAAAARAAATAWSTPEAMAAGEARLISAATNVAANMFAEAEDASEQIDAYVAARLEEFQRTAIMRAIGQGETKIGRRLYDEAVERGVVTLEEDDLLTRTVQFGERIDVVVNGATAIVNQFPNDRAAAIDAARRMGLDGDTERNLVAEIEGRFSAADRIEQDNVADLTERARQAAVDGTLYDTFSPADLAMLPQATLDRLGYINRGGGQVSDPSVFNMLEQDQNVLMEADLTEYMDQLSPTDYASLVQRQATLRRAYADAAATEAERQAALVAGADIYNRSQIIDQAIETYQIRDAQQQAHLRRTVEAWEAGQRASGVEPTNEARRQFIDSLMVTAPTRAPGIFGGTAERRVIDVLLGRDRQLRFPDIPLLDLTQIATALQAQGLPLSDENIRQLYEQAQEGQ
jgi:hypothetical protein